ncbi:MAG TPA: GEVED domain-containing protein, partial [Flavobacterium sp.]|uniref:GEVED domain-containing protein n=2 Tax=unclassified Flavobacterium TaxID=196869 RepID=UPI002628682B
MNSNYNFLNTGLGSLFDRKKLEQSERKSSFSSNSLSLTWLSSFILTMFLLIGQETFAQVANYTFATTSGTYTPITGGTLHGTGVDDSNYSFVIPFTFTYNGTGYTTARPTSNGFLVLGANAPSTTNYTPLSSGSTNFAIAALANDLNSTIRSEVLGTAPNRIYVCQWSSAFRYSAGGGDVLNTQIRLYEGSNKIEIVYGSCTTTNTTLSTRPLQVGLRGSSTSDFNNRTTTTNWASTTTGGTNSASCALTTTVLPSSGLTLTWTPPAPPSCGAPTTLAVTDIQTTTADLSWVAPSTGTPASYDWEIRTSGAGGSGSTGLTTSGNVTAPTVSVNDTSGLTEGTAYNFYVRTNCTGGDGSSTWAGPIAFTTRKSCPTGLGGGSITITTLPYSATGLTNSGAGNNVTATNVSCVAGSASYYGAEDKTYIFTPTVSGVYTILLTTATDDDSGIMLYQGCPFTTGSVCVANAQSTSGLTRTLTPTLTAGLTYYLVVDNFPAPAFITSYSLSISLPPTCGVPTSLGVSDITLSTADLSWVAPIVGTAASYDWEIRTSGAGGSGATGLVNSGNVTAPTVTVDNASGLSAGTSYNLYVRTNCTGGDGSSTWAGPFAFSTPVAGESCSTAATIAVAPNVGSAVNTLLTTGATADGPAGTCSDATGNPNKKDRWIKFVAPSNGNRIVISTSSGSITDAVMQLWSSCPATGGALGCSDDVNGLMPELSLCQNQYTPGETYYVQVWPWSSTATGNFNLRIYEETACPEPPANDECGGVETLTLQAFGNCPANATTGTTIDATATPGVVKTTCDAFGTYLDVFYKFNTGNNSAVNIAFTSLTGTCEFGLYSGCGTGYLEICSSSSPYSNSVSGLTPNTDYYIVVWSNSIATQGTFTLCVSEPAKPDYVNLQFPGNATIQAGNSVTVYAQVYEGGLTDVEPGISGQASGIEAWIGISPQGQNTNPNTWTTWIPATHNAGQVSNNDEYQANIGSTLAPGTYYYASRFRLSGGPFVYGGYEFNEWNGTSSISGVLTVNPNPSQCAGLGALANASSDVTVGTVALSWTAPVSGPAPTSYDVYFGTTSGSLALVTNTTSLTYNASAPAFSTTYYWRIVPKSIQGGEAIGCAEWSFTTQADPFAPYCSNVNYGTNNGGVEPITLVNFAGINNPSSSTLDINSLENFISISGNVTAGNSYSMTLKGNTDGSFTNNFRVFVDWNQDGDFNDDGETYNAGSINNSTGLDAIQAISTIEVPANALAGTTRMRIKKLFQTTDIDNACSGGGFGQSEDYTLVVSLKWYLDSDNDTYGDSTMMIESVTQPVGTYVLVGGDCNDNNNTVYPGAAE